MRRRTRDSVTISLLAMPAVILALCGSVAAFDVVKNGQPQTAIVIPNQPLPVVTYAAQELQYHIQQASGCILPIVKEDMVKDRSVISFPGLIYLGDCRQTMEKGIDTGKLSTNSFIIRMAGPDFFIAGNDSAGEVLGYGPTRVGTLFGVYEFLEKQLGVKWLWPGKLGEVIHAAANITVTRWEQTETPRFAHNRWRSGPFLPDAACWSSQQAKDRYYHEQDVWLKRQRFTVGIPMDIHHAFTEYWARFGQTQPEYFNLLPDGTRRSTTVTTNISMDVSEPGLWKQIVADWQAKRWPQNAPWMDVSENDSNGKCTCGNCLAWDVPDPDNKTPFDERLKFAKEAFAKGDTDWDKYLGSLSDRYAKFYLAVQKEAEKVDPNAVVMGLAYANYWKPPLQTKLNSRVAIALVPNLMFPWTDEKREGFRKQWEGWSATGASLMLRPNYTLDGHCFPIFFADKLGSDVSFAAKKGLIGTDFDSLTGQWATQGPNLYMLARILNDPDRPVEEILDDYYNAFGPAKEYVKTYFAYWKKISDAVTDKFYEQAGGNYAFYNLADKIFTPQVMEKGLSFLAQAKKAAEQNETSLKRVIFLEKGLRHAQLTLQTQAAYEEYTKTGNLAPFKQALGELDQFRRDNETDDISNPELLRATENYRWPRNILNMQTGRSLGRLWKFAWDPQKEGETFGWWKDGFDDASWEQISILDFWTESDAGRRWKKEHQSDYEGVAWYRTAFTIPASSSPRRYFLVFGAVHGPCKIWLNGQSVLVRPYPYEGDPESIRKPFQFEITSCVRFDKPNTIAVQTEYTVGAAGIWKPVELIEAEGTSPGEKNIIPDSEFENSQTWGKSIMSGQCTFAVDDKEKFSGKSSGRITCSQKNPDTGKSWARWYQSFPVQKGNTYRLTLWVKTSVEFNGSVRIWFLIGTAEKSALVSSTGGLWQQVVVPDIVSQDENASIYLNLMDGTGTVWFNDVKVTQVSK